MQGKTVEPAENDDEDRIIDSDGRAADNLKAAIDARWDQTDPG